MKYSNIKYFCTSNGEGVRTAIFVSGCRLHCKGCFNFEAWDFNFGKEVTDEVIDKILDSIEPVYISGLSILGGEPLDEKNLEGVSYLIKRFRERFGVSKNIWIWSGYVYENMSDSQRKVAKQCDYLIDGPFEAGKTKDNMNPWAGSSNQRLLKM